MKFIHTGDIHWGMTPDADKPWGSERAQAIKDTFKKIIAQAGKMQADCLFISGDLFHRQPLVRDLKEVNYLFTTIPNVKVILIAGNHDRIRENSALLSFSWSPNVTFSWTRTLIPFILRISIRKFTVSVITPERSKTSVRRYAGFREQSYPDPDGTWRRHCPSAY